jgi:hypothetical protein
MVFSRPRYAGGQVRLVFGSTGTAPTPLPTTATGFVDLGGITISGQALYDNRNPARATASVRAAHQVAQQDGIGFDCAWGLSEPKVSAPADWWQRARPVVHQNATGWFLSDRHAREVGGPWQGAQPREVVTALVHQAALQVSNIARSAWQPTQSADARVAIAALVHQAALSLVRQLRPAWQRADGRQALAVGRHGSGMAVLHQRVAPWQIATPVPPGRERWPPDVPLQPIRIPSTRLVFACPPWSGGPVHLVFGRVCSTPTGPLAPLFILPARFFMAVHSLIAHRLPDLSEIPIYEASISADAGSFAWTFSARGPVSLFDALAPAGGLPAQLRITLDGIPFVFVVDSLQHELRFGQSGVRVSGRSATALLARPYARELARVSTAVATAQQLALDALQFTGADLDWGLTDWLVPAGAWSHTGTPLAAVQAIVEAAGGYLQSHRSLATLLARHPYPELPGGIPGGPWNWSGAFAADVELAPDALITRSIERRDGADINGVYVSGQNQGVLALVRRTGTAADKLASMVVDPLIVASEVALQRGLSVLGAGGPKHLVQSELPILTGAGQPGVLDVGQLVQINDTVPWRGRVRSVSVNATLPKARQVVTIERHLEVAP